LAGGHVNGVGEVDGHDHDALNEEINTLRSAPTAIIANTIKGKGVDFMENKLAWHYKSPNDDEMKNAISQLYK
jgi:transketolase